MLLYEKALFSWDVADAGPYPIALTGVIGADYQIERNGELKPLNGEAPTTQNRYQLIGAAGDIWTEVLASRKIWRKLVVELNS